MINHDDLHEFETQRNPRIERDEQLLRGVVKRIQLREPHSLLVVEIEDDQRLFIQLPRTLIRDVRRGSTVRMYAKRCSAALWEATSLQIEPPLPSNDTTQPLPQSELDFNEAVGMLADSTGMIQLRDMIGRLTNALRRWPGMQQPTDLQAARRKLALQCLQYIRLLLSAQDSIVLEENEIAIKNLVNEVRRLTK